MRNREESARFGRRLGRPSLRDAAALVLSLSAALPALAVPPGFIDEPFSDDGGPVGITFAPDGHLFAWHKDGRVFIIEQNGHQAHDPVIDIHDEVGNWNDHGLLGFALDPDFETNGYIYLLYVVDHHHLIHSGTPDYDPAANEYYRATIGRITRYTTDAGHTADPASRLVLVGETAATGLPLLHLSHGVGSLVFGADGTLLVSCGDGASFQGVDTGGPVAGSYAETALADGIIRPKEDVGVFRAQLVDCHNGKILRIDPATGDGVPSNPYYDPAAPRAPRSRVWALGFRNPFRFTRRPGTGSADPADGDPGVLIVGDVGLNDWEELNVVTGPGMNFGWPSYEGMGVQIGYFIQHTLNLDAPNPLFGSGGCDDEFFEFNDLLIHATLAAPTFPNPCDPKQEIPESIPRFVHERPAIDWGHPITGPARTGIFDGDDPAVIDIGAPGSPVAGPQFGGKSSTGGVWYEGAAFPPPYDGAYFHGDYGRDWIRHMVFGPDHRPLEVGDVFTSSDAITAIAVGPHDGALYYVKYPQCIGRIVYVGEGNQPPTAAIRTDVAYGPSPLAISFTGSGSTDPEGLPLEYAWDFGDGSASSAEADPVHVFTAPPGTPTPYTVTLTVTDAEAATAEATTLISVNNTPPVVTITSPAQGDEYSVQEPSEIDLTAIISDAEHEAGTLTCAWLTTLIHDDHEHPEPADPACATTTMLAPLGCGVEDYHYVVQLTVSDPAGLSTTESVAIFPRCIVCADVTGDDLVGFADVVAILSNWGDCGLPCPADLDGDWKVGFLDLLLVLSRWGPCE